MDQLCPLLSFYFCLPYTDHNVLILFSLHFSCSRRVKKKKVQARNFLAMQLTLTRNCSTRQLALWGEGPLSYFLNLQHLAQCLLHIRSQKLFVENDWMNSLLKPFFCHYCNWGPYFDLSSMVLLVRWPTSIHRYPLSIPLKVVFKLYQMSESWRGFVQTQIAGPHPQSFWFRWSWWDLRIHISDKFSGDSNIL